MGLLLLCAGVDARWGTGGKKITDAKKRAKVEQEIYEAFIAEDPTLTEEDLLVKMHIAKKKLDADRVEDKRAKARQRQLENIDDPWASGLYVKYMAYCCAGILGFMVLFVMKDTNLDELVGGNAAKDKKKEKLGKKN